MSDTSPGLRDNAIHCICLLHRVLGAGLLLSLIVVCLPTAINETTLSLQFINLAVPIHAARWTCAAILLLFSFAALAILKQLQELYIDLATTEYRKVIQTYPSVATLGEPTHRLLFGYILALIWFIIGSSLLTPTYFLGGRADLGIAFLYAVPMIFLRNG